MKLQNYVKSRLSPDLRLLFFKDSEPDLALLLSHGKVLNVSWKTNCCVIVTFQSLKDKESAQKSVVLEYFHIGVQAIIQNLSIVDFSSRNSTPLNSIVTSNPSGTGTG